MPGQIPLIGEEFPEMEVLTDFGKLKLPDEYTSRGKWFILFSHPADFTPVCTTEFVSFAKNYRKFKDIGVELIGLSVDSVYSHIKWKEWIKENTGVEIPFPIIADPQGYVARKLGLIHVESSTHTVRAVFIVDDKRVIRAILYYPLELGRWINEIARMVYALKISDKYGRAIPANWPENELFGEDLIVPPASKYDEAMERIKDGKYRCLDWWICHDRPFKEEEIREIRRIVSESIK